MKKKSNRIRPKSCASEQDLNGVRSKYLLSEKKTSGIRSENFAF